jgi:hypothetical protein
MSDESLDRIKFNLIMGEELPPCIVAIDPHVPCLSKAGWMTFVTHTSEPEDCDMLETHVPYCAYHKEVIETSQMLANWVKLPDTLCSCGVPYTLKDWVELV